MSEPHRSSTRLDRWLSIAAGVAALCAVAISLYQAALAREQQRASAWPYLVQSNSYAGIGAAYTREVENVGVGPARIRMFQLRVDGRPVADWETAVRMLTGAPDSGIVYSSFGRGRVLSPGKSLTLLRLPPGAQAQRFWTAAQTRLETIICFCSIYDECWSAGSSSADPTDVKSCAEDRPEEARR
jgi:hypothetical protein